MTDRWTRKIVAFLHDPPGKALVLLSKPHIRHKQLAEALQRIALGRVPSKEEHDLADRADRIASAADRVNFPSPVTAYWDEVTPCLTHPLAVVARPHIVPVPSDPSKLIELNERIQEAAARDLVGDWAASLGQNPDRLKGLYFRLWRLLYEETSRRMELGPWLKLLPADTRQPDHTLEQHLSVTAALADALPHPAVLILSIGPVQSFISASRRTQDLWMASWLLSYLSWSAMEPLVDNWGPDVILYPSLYGQPLADHWLSGKHGGLPRPREDALARPTLPNKFVALLPASEAEEGAKKAEEAVRTRWLQLATKVLDRLRSEEILPSYGETEPLWKDQLARLLEVYWVVLPWPGYDRQPGSAQAEAVRKLYLELLQPPSDWQWDQAYQALTKSGQYETNWGTAYSLLYDLADRAFGSRKAVRQFQQAEEVGEKCTVCGQRAAIRSSDHDARSFWAQTANNLRRRNRFDIKPDGDERLCAVCAVKRFVQREVLREEEGFGLEGNFPSTGEVAAAPFKKRIIELLIQDDSRIGKPLEAFLDRAKALSGSVAIGAIPYLEKLARSLPERPGDLARKLLGLEGEYLFDESWTLKRLGERWPDVSEDDAKAGRAALAELYRAAGMKPTRYLALLYMDGDHMGRWLSGSHEGLASFGSILHPEVRDNLRGNLSWQPLLEQRRLITPALHAAISHALAHFSLRLVPFIVEERYPGRIVYAGGDDVLALVPMVYAFPVARELRAAFSGNVRCRGKDLQVCLDDEQVTGYLELDGDVLLTMGPSATASVGLAFAHQIQPMDLMIQAVRRAEKAAKRVYGRNALVVEVLKRSGETLRVGTKWAYDGTKDAMALIIKVLDSLNMDKISSKWPYAVDAEAYTLQGLPKDAQRAEMRRLLRRHAGENISQEERERQSEELSGELVQWAEEMSRTQGVEDGFLEMARWLLTCAFVARGTET